MIILLRITPCSLFLLTSGILSLIGLVVNSSLRFTAGLKSFGFDFYNRHCFPSHISSRN